MTTSRVKQQHLLGPIAIDVALRSVAPEAPQYRSVQIGRKIWWGASEAEVEPSLLGVGGGASLMCEASSEHFVKLATQAVSCSASWKNH